MKIATHDGIWHADEVCAIAVMFLIDDASNVTRSRDKKDWDASDMVIDVGGRYDGQKYFDHHQQNSPVRKDDGVPYTSFGLVWKHFGDQAIQATLNNNGLKGAFDSVFMGKIWNGVECIVLAVDAQDQGILSINSVAKMPNRKYPVELFHLSQIVLFSNAAPLIDDWSPEETFHRFMRVLQMVIRILESVIIRKASRFLSEEKVNQADKGGPIMYLDKYCDWLGPVFSRPHINVVVFKAEKNFVVQCVKAKDSNGSVALKRQLPEVMVGKDELEIERLTGIAGVVFCHKDRFMASVKSQDSAMQLAEMVNNSAT